MIDVSSCLLWIYFNTHFHTHTVRNLLCHTLEDIGPGSCLGSFSCQGNTGLIGSNSWYVLELTSVYCSASTNHLSPDQSNNIENDLSTVLQITHAKITLMVRMRKHTSSVSFLFQYYLNTNFRTLYATYHLLLTLNIKKFRITVLLWPTMKQATVAQRR